MEQCCLELDNNAAERAIKPVIIGPKSWMFEGSKGGGEAIPITFTLIGTAKLNSVNLQAWLSGVLERIAGHKISCLDKLYWLKLLPALFMLAACSQPVAETGLPEGAAKANSTYMTESLLIGVKPKI
ncbi:transposase domain-containing protein [uncultured Ruegeria sp.]|uniref:transposase domain-containing protein n=1 Tax=uncultured Ruegeria sp. TaxID=259304 RepID=UPI00262C819A|nr:transposase domain-containing protein [uncultured Ruegeria sp.]